MAKVSAALYKFAHDIIMTPLSTEQRRCGQSGWRLSSKSQGFILVLVSSAGARRYSFAERQNLTLRMSSRRFMRWMNAFSKQFENHCHTLALYLVFGNFRRVHKTLGVALDAEAAKIPTVRGPYRKKVDEISNRDTIGPSAKPAPVRAVARWCKISAGNSR